MGQDKTNGRVTVTEYVARSIRERIISGVYLPGTKLDQQTLVEEFGATLIPVRESLRQLEAQGFIRLYPHRGAYVAELSIDEFEEIYFVRELLETAATELAVPKLSEADKRQLRDYLTRMEQATKASNYAQLLGLNHDFHFIIYKASANQLLIELIRSLWDRSSRYRHLYTYMPERAARALAEHKRIYRLCLAGDAIAAGQAVGHNVRQTVRVLLPILRRQLASPSTS